ncbi:MAG: polyribonucleotide nucleotidyltransferase [Candidatus Margulisiibacteriota bacterium]|jgi:polyribonucleotide nucleotidyltransferase
MYHKVTAEIAGREITLETGKLAKQANGAVVLKCGNLVMLATAVMSKKAKENIDFFPLTVEYSEKLYASGKIPGGFFKREARPSINATLTSRLIDRPIRPCFPDGMHHEVQVGIMVLSYDESLPNEYLGVLAASACLAVSDIPFNGPVGAALISCVDGQLKANPSIEDLEKSTLNITVAGTKDAILMIESEAKEVSEELIIEALRLARVSIKEMVLLQEELAGKLNITKKDVVDHTGDPKLEHEIRNLIEEKVISNLKKGNKQEIEDFLVALENEVVEKFVDAEKTNEALVKKLFYSVKKDVIRKTIINEKIRPDGRRVDEIRPISIEAGLLPGAHGSALFTRGETQSLAVVTLGTADDEQIEDGLKETFRKRYYFHYNFPPFSVGEVGMMNRTGRRELGHGALAEKSLKAVLPDFDRFPYTIRIVSEILESNGSSSMASVCGGTLALMDAGVPISAPVSGIAMGLLIDKNGYIILSDIQGLEDHYGDMDFKVAGTKKGITALQLDIKVAGLSEDILVKALAQANAGRAHILNEMVSVLAEPRSGLASGVPKIDFLAIPTDKFGLVSGTGGKMIKKIEEECGVDLNLTDGDGGEGQVAISAKSQEAIDKAKYMITMLIKKIEPGEVYEGKVIKIMNFGAFIELVPGKEGLLHISKIAKTRVERVEDFLEIGQVITVKVKEVDQQNRINLEMADLL